MKALDALIDLVRRRLGIPDLEQETREIREKQEALNRSRASLEQAIAALEALTESLTDIKELTDALARSRSGLNTIVIGRRVAGEGSKGDPVPPKTGAGSGD